MPLDSNSKANLPELLTFLKNVRTLHNQLILISRLPLTEEQEEFTQRTVRKLSATVNSFLAKEGQE